MKIHERFAGPRNSNVPVVFLNFQVELSRPMTATSVSIPTPIPANINTHQHHSYSYCSVSVVLHLSLVLCQLKSDWIRTTPTIKNHQYEKFKIPYKSTILVATNLQESQAAPLDTFSNSSHRHRTRCPVSFQEFHEFHGFLDFLRFLGFLEFLGFHE